MFTPTVEKIIQPFLFRHYLVLDELPQDVRLKIEASYIPMEMGAGEILFRQGAYPKGAFKVRSGLVKITHCTSQGQRQLVYVYGAGDWIGFRQIITKEAYPIVASAVENVIVDFIPLEAFQKLLREEPLLVNNLLETVSHEFSVWVNRLTVFSRFQMRARLALCLLILQDRFSVSGKSVNPIKFSRQDLADFIGGTLETTVRTLSEFKEAGWVKTSGKQITVLDAEALAGVVGEI
ncbi:MAG: Crp/Fnr family transcriptional regulator [Saprospiraceae bacterium]|nr:Crp/Fnr family transcriptional regulator [Saprospiraceae bacterium]